MQAIEQNFNFSFITVFHIILTGCYCELFWFRYLKTVKLDLLIVTLVKFLQNSSRSVQWKVQKASPLHLFLCEMSYFFKFQMLEGNLTALR